MREEEPFIRITSRVDYEVDLCIRENLDSWLRWKIWDGVAEVVGYRPNNAIFSALHSDLRRRS